MVFILQSNYDLHLAAGSSKHNIKTLLAYIEIKSVTACHYKLSIAVLQRCHNPHIIFPRDYEACLFSADCSKKSHLCQWKRIEKMTIPTKTGLYGNCSVYQTNCIVGCRFIYLFIFVLLYYTDRIIIFLWLFWYGMLLSNQKIQDCGNPLYFPTQLWGRLEFLQGDICQKIVMSGDKKNQERGAIQS